MEQQSEVRGRFESGRADELVVANADECEEYVRTGLFEDFAQRGPSLEDALASWTLRCCWPGRKYGPSGHLIPRP